MDNKSKIIFYEKPDRVYEIKKGKLSEKSKKILTIILSSLIFVIGIVLLLFSVEFSGNKPAVTYEEKGNVDYTVYLNQNTYYETNYLNKNVNSIISDLINTINVEFDYEVDSSKELKYEYSYQIIGTLNIKEKDTESIIFTKDYVLSERKQLSKNNNAIQIHDDVNIDYNKYNAYATSFKRDYVLAADSELVVKMIVGVNGKTPEVLDELNSNQTFELVIPLTSQTINLKANNNGYQKVDALNYNGQLNINNIFMLVISIILILITIIYGLKKLIGLRKYVKKDIYFNELKKLLKENDTHIVNATSSYKEAEGVIRVGSFEELLDARKIENCPILFYEVEKNNKSYFVVKGVNDTYRFTLSRAYLEKFNKKNN